MSPLPNKSTSPLGKLFDRELPYSFESESALLGSMILDANVILDVLAIVPRPEDFYDQSHALIFQAILHVFDRNNPTTLDLVLIQDRLKQQGVYEQVGGGAKLRAIVEGVPAPSNAPHYAQIVAEKARLRSIIEIGGRMVYDAYHAGGQGPDGAKEIIDAVETAIFEMGRDRLVAEPEELNSIVDDAMQNLEIGYQIGPDGIMTGYPELDGMLRGLQCGDLIIIAARPSQGKSAIALNIAEQIAIGNVGNGSPLSVGILSLEMSKKVVGNRLISAHSGLSNPLLRWGGFGGEPLRKFEETCGILRTLPITVDDTPAMTITQLRAKARRMVRKGRLSLLIVDYIQLLTAPGAGRESRQVEVAAISRGMKALARELKIPIICLSQLNRDCEKREGNRPRLSDLRESGSLEQDADVVMLLHREETFHIEDPGWAEANPDKVGLAELIIAKQRNGPTGVVKLWWDKKAMRFKNHDGESEVRR